MLASSSGAGIGQNLCVTNFNLVLALQGHSGKYYIKVDPLTWVWCASIADNLSQQDAKGPDVGFDGEGAVVDGFGGCPLDGEFGSWLLWKIENQSNQII